MNEDPLRIFRVLSAHGVPYVIIGGHAVSIHGQPRATEDADVVYERTADSETRLFEALTEINARWVSNEKDPSTGWELQIPVTPAFIQSRNIIWLITDGGFLDVMDHVPGCPGAKVRDLLDQAIIVNGLPYASRDWMIRMKKAAGRSKDLQDLENLEPPPG